MPPTVNVADEQLTTTPVTLPEPTVPVRRRPSTSGPDGCVCTVTANGAPLATAVANVNEPFALTVRASPPSSKSTTVPVSPVTVPPTVKLFVVQVTSTVVTFPVTTPLPFATAQVCEGTPGWVRTVTLYEAPTGTGAANVKPPFWPTVRLSPPPSSRATSGRRGRTRATLRPTVKVIAEQTTEFVQSRSAFPRSVVRRRRSRRRAALETVTA